MSKKRKVCRKKETVRHVDPCNKEEEVTPIDMHEEIIRNRKAARQLADSSESPIVRSLMKDLLSLEVMASPFYLGLDYADILEDDFGECYDLDEIRPY